MKKFRDAWLRFRSSNAFLGCLFVFAAGWFTARYFIGFDPDNSILNIILSFEASVATCMILDLQFRDRGVMARMARLLKRIERNEEQILASIEEDETDA